MFRKTKLSSAVVIALATTVSATMLTGLTGCKLTEGGTSITGGASSNVTNPKGTVTGNVQDTNGNAMAGVVVYLAGKNTKTDAGGNYRFTNIPVTNTTGTGSDTANGTLVVTIAPAAGYLGATVTVKPEAQINNNGDNGGGSINPVTTFIDGFIASAGTAVIPALTSTVTGVLRNADTDEPIVNTLVSLDMEGAGAAATGQESTHNVNTAIGYQTLAYTATTGADGSFTITNVPSDSNLIFEIEGHDAVSIAYNDDGVATHVNTSGEDITTNVGNVLATVQSAVDDAAPYVTSVTGVQDQTAATGQFNDDIDGTAGIVITFSEAMDGTQVDANSVVLYDTSNSAYIAVTSATMAADGLSMTITTAAAIPEGANFDVNFLRADFVDLAGNNIAAVAAANDVGYDSVVTSASNASDVYRLDLRIFKQINTNANAVTLAELDTDATGSDDDSAVQASNGAFADVRDAGDGFQQLNSADDDDTLLGSDAGERLDAYVTAIGGTGVDADVVRLDFTPDNASYYEVTIVDETGAANNAAVLTLDSNPDGVTLTDLGGNTFEISDMGGSTSTIEMVIEQVAPGHEVEITPFDDLNYAGASNVITLTDRVPPTAVLQNSYTATPTNNAQVVSVTFGNGGELSNIGSSIVGLPILNVTAQLLDNLEANGDSIIGDGVADDSLIAELMDNNTVDVGGTDLPFITPANAGPYDATAYAALNTARTIGFSMSEDVTLVAATTPAYSGTNASLSGYVENNDVTVNDAGAAVNVDLVNADVDGVFLLAADDSAIVDFAGTIQDAAGNVATDGSVVIRDAMPPMVTSAYYDGASMSITFNEPITDPSTWATTTMTVGGVTVNVNDPAQYTVTGNTLDITDPAAWGGNINRTGVFAAGIYTEAAYAAVVGVSSDAATLWGHGTLNIANAEDVNGNTWAADSAGVTMPTFAMTDASGDNTVASARAGYAIGSSLVTLTYTTDHPIDLTGWVETAPGSGVWDHPNSATVSTYYTLTNQDDAASSIQYTEVTQEVQVAIATTVALVATDDLGVTAAPLNVTSDYDSADTDQLNIDDAAGAAINNPNAL